MLRLKYLLLKLSIQSKKWIERNFNPFYHNREYVANINEIIKELHIHESKILEEHKYFIELNKVTIIQDLNNNKELKEDIINYLSSKEEYVDIVKDIKEVIFKTHSYDKTASKLLERVMFTAVIDGRLSIVLDMELIEYVFRGYLYVMCKTICELQLGHVSYYDGNKYRKLEHFFSKLIEDLDIEFKPIVGRRATLDPISFLAKYDKRYKEYITKHILNVSNFVIKR